MKNKHHNKQSGKKDVYRHKFSFAAIFWIFFICLVALNNLNSSIEIYKLIVTGIDAKCYIYATEDYQKHMRRYFYYFEDENGYRHYDNYYCSQNVKKFDVITYLPDNPEVSWPKGDLERTGLYER